MKPIVYISAMLFIFLTACSAPKDKLEITDVTAAEKAAFNSKDGEPVKIANDSIEYEIIILDPGFYSWINSIARPKGYYTQDFMENRNRIYVTNWNIRAMNPTAYDPNLYQMPIDYDYKIDYGYDVNYQLYNYFLYFQRKYGERLGPFYPRIN